MREINDLLNDLDAAGVVLKLSQTGKPIVSAPPGVLTPQLRDRLRQHRDTLIGMMDRTAKKESPTKTNQPAAQWRAPAATANRSPVRQRLAADLARLSPAEARQARDEFLCFEAWNVSMRGEPPQQAEQNAYRSVMANINCRQQKARAA